MALAPDFRILSAYYTAAILLPLSLVVSGWAIDHASHLIDSKARPCSGIDWNGTNDSCQSKLSRVGASLFFAFALGQLFVIPISIHKEDGRYWRVTCTMCQKPAPGRGLTKPTAWMVAERFGWFPGVWQGPWTKALCPPCNSEAHPS